MTSRGHRKVPVTPPALLPLLMHEAERLAVPTLDHAQPVAGLERALEQPGELSHPREAWEDVIHILLGAKDEDNTDRLDHTYRAYLEAVIDPNRAGLSAQTAPANTSAAIQRECLLRSTFVTLPGDLRGNNASASLPISQLDKIPSSVKFVGSGAIGIRKTVQHGHVPLEYWLTIRPFGGKRWG